MAHSKRPADPDAQQLQDLIRAGIGELTRISVGADSSQSAKRPLPAVPRAAQLSMFLLLLTKGLDRKHAEMYAHKERLEEHLGKVYKRAKACWEEALVTKSRTSRERQLQDMSGVELFIEALARFAEKTFGTIATPLHVFGVTDVQAALGALVRKIATATRRDLGMQAQGEKTVAGKKRGKAGSPSPDIPPPVLGGLLAASVGGDVALLGKMSPDQAKAARVAVWIGTSKADPKTPEGPAVRKLRRTLEGLGQHTQSPGS